MSGTLRGKFDSSLHKRLNSDGKLTDLSEIARHNEALDPFICFDIVFRIERQPDSYTVS